MRHVLSFFAGVVAALLTWILLSTGQHRWQMTVLGWDSTASFSTIGLLGPTVFLLIAAMMLGLVATTRISPMGPIAAGLMFTVPTIMMFTNPFSVLNWVSDSWRLLGQDFAPRLPMENGTLPFLGFMLLMATFSAKRWRRWPKPQPAPAPAPAPAVAPTPEAPAAAAPDADAAALDTATMDTATMDTATMDTATMDTATMDTATTASTEDTATPAEEPAAADPDASVAEPAPDQVASEEQPPSAEDESAGRPAATS
jgi:hypothetical protein